MYHCFVKFLAKFDHNDRFRTRISTDRWHVSFFFSLRRESEEGRKRSVTKSSHYMLVKRKIPSKLERGSRFHYIFRFLSSICFIEKWIRILVKHIVRSLLNDRSWRDHHRDIFAILFIKFEWHDQMSMLQFLILWYSLNEFYFIGWDNCCSCSNFSCPRSFIKKRSRRIDIE